MIKFMTKLKIIYIIFALILMKGSDTNSQQYPDTYGPDSRNGVLGNLAGQNRYIAVPHNFQLVQTSGTVEAWVYLNAYNPADSYILQKGTLFGLGVNGSGQLFARINNVTFQPGGAVPLNRWVHVAAAWTNSSPNYSVSFFIDGAQSGFVVMTANMPVNTDSLTIGGSKLSPPSYVDGYVDEVRLWHGVFNASAIAQRRFAGIGDAPIANNDSALIKGLYYESLLASWTFNISGTTVYEDISNYIGYSRGGAVPVFGVTPIQPIPYNIALYFPGREYDYVRVPHNTLFNLTTGGTIDMWVNYVPSTTGRTLISKGATVASTTFRLYIESSGSLRLQIGNNSVPGGVVPSNRWVHIAAAWTLVNGTYNVKFYINGQYMGQNSMTTTMAQNTNDVRIGGLQFDPSNYFSGWMDEVRIWQRELTFEEIKANMFNSARSQSTIGPLLAAWDFEGNLNNVAPNDALNGTFKINAGAFVPWCWFSGYRNESVAGPLSDMFDAHSTTINRNETPNPFPGGFGIKVPNKPIQQNASVYDTIYIPGNVAVSNVEVFLSLQHEQMQGIHVKLIAPNGQERTLVNGNGGNGHSILTFFKDGGNAQNTFYAPWSGMAAPINSFGTFGNSMSQGNWKINVQHQGIATDARLLGWGLRINNTLTGGNIISTNVPREFSLSQNYPNPFNPSTEIRFDVPKNEHVKIFVSDILGREVKVLVDEYKQAGEYSVTYDAATLPSGIYFYTMQAGTYSNTKKMIMIK